MNERIRQLAIQAGVIVSESNGFDRIRLTFSEVEFAQLIVQECINIIKPTQHHEAFAQGYLGDVDGLELLDSKVKQIKQHFGVE